MAAFVTGIDDPAAIDPQREIKGEAVLVDSEADFREPSVKALAVRRGRQQTALERSRREPAGHFQCAGSVLTLAECGRIVTAGRARREVGDLRPDPS